MNPLKGACIIGQSGGPTAVINASALGAIQSALQSEQVTRVLGAANGIEGVLKERLFDMAREDPGELELLKYTPASALGSCRYKMAAPSVDDTDYRRLLEISENTTYATFLQRRQRFHGYLQQDIQIHAAVRLRMPRHRNPQDH